MAAKRRSLASNSILWFVLTGLVPTMAVAVHAVLTGSLSWHLSVLLFISLAVVVLLGRVFTLFFARRLEELDRRVRDLIRDTAPAAVEVKSEDSDTLMGRISLVEQLLDRQRADLERMIRADVTSQLAAEKQQVEAFLRGIGDGISIVDADMRIIYVNDIIRDTFGDHLGEFCYRIYELKTEICPGCPVSKAMESGEIHHSLRRVYDKHGNLHYHESTGSPIRDESGKIIAGLELARDVTQRIKLERNVEIRSRQVAAANLQLRRTNEQLKHAYQDLKQAQIKLVHSEKMASLGVLVSGVAHEINNPLNFVSASVKLLSDNLAALMSVIQEYETLELPEPVLQRVGEVKEGVEYDYVLEDLRTNVKNIATGADRMKQVVQNLRIFSRLDAAVREDVNLAEGIESTLQILHHQYKDRIEIERDFGDIPEITGNPGQLNQVFMNLLHNAIQAIDGKGAIRISLAVRGECVLVTIADTGVGITEEDLAQVFDPFFTTKKVGEGTGLGLSISYSIVQDHGGQLWVESERGKGTTFFIELPISRKKPAKSGGNGWQS